MVEVIAEIGINHDGSFDKAVQMVHEAARVGCPTVKFQCHVVDDEYSHHAKDVIPPNAKESIYGMMARCSFTEDQDRQLKQLTESLGMRYLSTPFSRAAADRLERLGVERYKIGSGELNNYPLLKHVAQFGKPVILSTGMNRNLDIQKALDILSGCKVYLLHCVSMYPTPWEYVNIHRMTDLARDFGVQVGFSDHTLGITTSLFAMAQGASIIEKHYTLDRNWPGADNPISILPEELGELVRAADIHDKVTYVCRTPDDEGVKAFAFASVVTLRDIKRGEKLTAENIWVKRPAGGIPAAQYESVLGKVARVDIPADEQVQWSMLGAG